MSNPIASNIKASFRIHTVCGVHIESTRLLLFKICKPIIHQDPVNTILPQKLQALKPSKPHRSIQKVTSNISHSIAVSRNKLWMKKETADNLFSFFFNSLIHSNLHIYNMNISWSLTLRLFCFILLFYFFLK